MTASAPLVILFAAAAAFSLYELIGTRPRVRSYLADSEALAAHVVMNGAMAAMFSSAWGSTAERITFWILLIGAAVLVYRSVRAGLSGHGDRAGSAAYHAVGMAAMIYAIVLMPAGHTPMHHGMEMARPLAATVLAVVFALDALATLALAAMLPVRVFGTAIPAGAVSRRAIRRAALPHLAMDAGMVIMLL